MSRCCHQAAAMRPPHCSEASGRAGCCWMDLKSLKIKCKQLLAEKLWLGQAAGCGGVLWGFLCPSAHWGRLPGVLGAADCEQFSTLHSDSKDRHWRQWHSTWWGLFWLILTMIFFFFSSSSLLSAVFLSMVGKQFHCCCSSSPDDPFQDFLPGITAFSLWFYYKNTAGSSPPFAIPVCSCISTCGAV